MEHLEIVARQFNGYLQQVNALESLDGGGERPAGDKSRKELLDSFARPADLTDGVAGAAR